MFLTASCVNPLDNLLNQRLMENIMLRLLLYRKMSSTMLVEF